MQLKGNEMEERLKWLIRNTGESLEKFSKRMGVSKQTLINYNYGRTVPNCDQIRNLQDTMKALNLNWLISGTGEPFKDNSDPDRQYLEKLVICHEKLELARKEIQDLKDRSDKS